MTGPSPAIPLPDRLAARVMRRWPDLLPWLAGIESRCLPLSEWPALAAPVFVCGLARSGTTLLLELLAQRPPFTCHRYADFPGLWTPYWWNWLRQRLPADRAPAVERAHGDRLRVSRESPEALEEVLWQYYLERELPGRDSDALAADAALPGFAAAYREHLGKLLAVRGAGRYLAKNNYNLLRLRFLHAQFPDARFVLPFRAPVAHIASLIQQDRRFSAWMRADGRIAEQFAAVGHFEFGLGKRALRIDPARAAAIEAAWCGADPLAGWIGQWCATHEWLLGLLADPGLAACCHLVDYDAFCAAPMAGLDRLGAALGLPADPAWVERNAATISAPDYYRPDLTEGDRRRIEDAAGSLHTALRQCAER